MNCRHTDTVPVVERHRLDVINATSACEAPPVAHLCRDCDAQLPVNWGCTDCTWEVTETRRLYNSHVESHRACIHRCPTHQEAHP